MIILYLKIAHVIGAFFLFVGFGGLFGVGENRAQINRIVASLNGLGLLILFLSGFALQGIIIKSFPGWLITKIVLWAVMVALFFFTKKGKIPTFPGVLLSLIIGGIAAYLCLTKPF